MRAMLSEPLPPLRGSNVFINAPTRGWHPGLYAVRPLRGLRAMLSLTGQPVFHCLLPPAYYSASAEEASGGELRARR